MISNSSDALDKIRYESLTDSSVLEGAPEMKIEVALDKSNSTLVIQDTGVGMTKGDLVTNLGTIAKSGTKAFMEALTAGADISMIGQFGVGFYSAYLVAETVTVISKHNDDEQYIWESSAGGTFTVKRDEGESIGRGTKMILKLKEDQTEYLEERRVKDLVKKHSEFINYPINLWVEKTEEKEVTDDDDDDDEEKEEGEDSKIEEVDEDGEKKKKTKKVKEVTHEWELLNKTKPIWMRKAEDVTTEEYAAFYKSVSNDWEEHLSVKHFSVEGQLEFRALLFVPKRAPFDMFEPNKKKNNIKLYVRRVFIMDNCEDLIPEYLSFVKGVVDSEDLPLNISREVLQKAQTTNFISKQVASKTLALLEDLAEEGETTVKGDDGEEKTVRRYEDFWGHFGPVLKEGAHLDPQNKDRIAKLLRYQSSKVEGLTSLAEYVARMPEDQPGIYFITAVNLETARNSPHIESLRKRDYEVLFMTDPVDEWVVESLPQFDDKKLIAAGKGSLDLPDSDEAKKEREEKSGDLSEVIEQLKTRLDEQIKEVRVTDRLTESPACLVTGENDLSPHLERTLRAHGQDVPPQKRILEINPDHPVVSELAKLASDPDRKAEFDQWSELVYDQALVAEGALPEDPTRLARSIARLMKQVSGNHPES